jgi:hypothetical protein
MEFMMKGFNHLFFLFFLTLATACGGDGNSKNTPPDNIPPVATAGQDKTQAESTEVTLSGTGSTDTDGTISSYAWRQISGTQVNLSGSDQATASFTAPSTDTSLTLEFELSVTDNMGASSTDNVLVTVIPISPPPEVTIDFPIFGSRFFGDYITVSGTASKQGGIDGTSINVKVGNSNVNAQVDADGNWRAQNVPLPENLSNVVILATATDRVGQTGEAETKIENIPTLTQARFSFNPQLPNMLYAFEDTGNSYDRIIAINLETMERQVLFKSDSPWGDSGTHFDQLLSVDYDSLNNQIVLADWGRRIHTFDISQNLITTFELAGKSLEEGLRPYDVAVDSANNSAIFVDYYNQALVSVNLTNGNSIVISNNSGFGTGLLFNEPKNVSLETTKNRALVYDSGLDSILAVDLSTGNRSVIASNTVGTGDSLNAIRSLKFDSGKLIALSWPSVILEINLENGNRNVISHGYGESEQFYYAPQLLVDTTNNRYLISGFADGIFLNDSDSVAAVDKDTKERSILFKETVSSGPEIDSPELMAINPLQNIGYIWDDASYNLYEVNLSSGERKLFLGEDNGLLNPSDMALDRFNNQLLIIEPSQKAVIAIDLTTKLISIISNNYGGSTPKYDSPVFLAHSEQTGKLYVADLGLKAIFEVNLNTGARSIISSTDKGAGPEFKSLTAMAIDDDGSTIYLVDKGNGSTVEHALIAIDTSTGDRKVVSGYHVGAGSNLDGTHSIHILSGTNQALILDHQDLKLVDLSTGDRTILANSNGIGKGEPLLNIREITMGANESIIYALSSNYEAIFAIDRFSGDRVIISK